MDNYSFIQILKSFSQAELKQFEEFISNPYNNCNLKAVKLFKLLKIFYPDFAAEKLSKESLYTAVTGNKKFKESYIRNLLSDLNVLAERFLKISLIEKNPKFEKLFIEELKDRDLFDITEKKIKAYERNVLTNKAGDHSYYEDINFIYEIKSFLIVDKKLTDSFRDLQLKNAINLFLITVIEDSFYLLVEEQRVNVKHRNDFLNLCLEYMKNHPSDFKDSPLLLVFYNLCMCFLSDESDEYFKKAAGNFKKYFSFFSKIDKKNIYSVMQIYYLNKIAKGDNSRNKEFLKFMLEMLKFNILSHKKKDSINLNLYRNILVLCVMEKERLILKNFISKYINYVDPDSRESVLAYSNSQLNFLSGNFQTALELCNNINFRDLLKSTNDNLYFKNDIKTLTLKCLYELHAFENAISFIDTYKHFLRKSKLMKDEMKNNYLFFANSVNELIRLNNKFDEYSFKKLESKLNRSQLSSIGWVLEKLHELGSSR